MVEFAEHPIIETGGIDFAGGYTICAPMKKNPTNRPKKAPTMVPLMKK